MDSIDKLLILPVFKASTTAVPVPAVCEGWGLVVTEGNALGTPVIRYDVHLLRDSMRSDETAINVIKNYLMRWHSRAGYYIA
jgi:glycosyltransferase involved in cell wall biosynthesis